MRRAMVLSALSCTLLFAADAGARTPFELEVRHPAAQVHGEAAPSARNVGLAPSPVPAGDRQFFVFVNAGVDTDGNPTTVDGCTTGSPADPADCYSLTAWTERTVRALLFHAEFQQFLQGIVDDLGDAPLLDTELSIPLIGTMNVGLHLQDLWNGKKGVGGCKLDPATTTNKDNEPTAGPYTLANPNRQIGCKFEDDDARAIDLIGELLSPDAFGQPRYTLQLRALGVAGDALAPGQAWDGSIQVDLTIPTLDADIVLRQPDYPTQVTSNYYVHAAGKARLKDVTIRLRLFSVGGNLRGLFRSLRQATFPTNAQGYGVGVDFEYLRIGGSLVLDLDSFKCWSTDFALPNRWTYCNAAVLDPAHPDYNNAALYRSNTDDKSKLTAEIVRYIEAHLVYEAERVSGAVANYLTALEALDVSSLTHVYEAGYLYPPEVSHPFDDQDPLVVDYSFFWRFNAQQHIDTTNFGAVVIAGGYGLDVDYAGGAACADGNPVPPAATPPVVPVAEVDRFSVVKRNGKAMLGLGLHIDPINRALDAMWRQHALCMTISADTPTLGAVLGPILTGAGLRGIVPTLDPKYDDRQVKIRLVPRFVPPGATVGDYTAADQPRARFCGPSDPCDPAHDQYDPGDPDRYTGPYDMQVTLPNLELQFLIDESGGGNFMQIFSLVMQADIWLGLGWYRVNNADLPPALQAPVCAGWPNPCRVLRLSFSAASALKQVHNYQMGTFLRSSDFRDVLPSVLAALLNGWLKSYAEIAINTSRLDFLGIVIDPIEEHPKTSPFYKGTLLEGLDLAAPAGQVEYLGLYARIGDLYGQYDTSGSRPTGPDGYADELNPAMLLSLLEGLGLADFGLAPGSTPGAPRVRDPHPSPVAIWDLGDELRGTSVRLSAVDVARLGLDRSGARLPVVVQVAGDAAATRLQYRIDGGLFQNAYGHHVRLPWLFDGEHMVEVWAVDGEGYLSSRPAELRFIIDRRHPAATEVAAEDEPEGGFGCSTVGGAPGWEWALALWLLLATLRRRIPSRVRRRENGADQQ